MKKLVILLSLIVSGNVFAKNICVCQTGAEPVSEIKFFKAGCSAWLKVQRCDERKMVSINDDLDALLKNSENGGTLKLGYVGHWSSSNQTNHFLKERIIPLSKKKNMNVNIDNSACSAMSDAFIVQDLLTKAKEEGLQTKITFKGNQAISLGLWNWFIGFTYNLPATASTEFQNAKFPKCEEFENKSCSESFQDKENGFCVNEIRQLERLQCNKMEKIVVNSESEMKVIEHSWERKAIHAEPYLVKAFDSQKNEVALNDSNASRFRIYKAGDPSSQFELTSKSYALDIVRSQNEYQKYIYKRALEWRE